MSNRHYQFYGWNPEDTAETLIVDVHGCMVKENKLPTADPLCLKCVLPKTSSNSKGDHTLIRICAFFRRYKTIFYLL